MAYSWIYVFSNQSHSGLLKIGYSSKDPSGERLSQLQSTGVPTPFECEYRALVEDGRMLELEIHQNFEDVRVSQNREFFRADLTNAIAGIRKVAGNRIVTEFLDLEVRKEIERKEKESRREEEKKERLLQKKQREQEVAEQRQRDAEQRQRDEEQRQLAEQTRVEEQRLIKKYAQPFVQTQVIPSRPRPNRPIIKVPDKFFSLLSVFVILFIFVVTYWVVIA